MLEKEKILGELYSNVVFELLWLFFFLLYLEYSFIGIHDVFTTFDVNKVASFVSLSLCHFFFAVPKGRKVKGFSQKTKPFICIITISSV